MNDSTENTTYSTVEKTAIKMLKDKIDLKLISSVTGLSIDELLILKSKI